MQDFLPVTKKEMQQRGWDQVDFVYLTGDAYVDHPSFGAAIISRLLESPTGVRKRVYRYLARRALVSWSVPEIWILW